ncbi:uncharacterized protein BJ171DRAFT_610356 [Polychytrium aggregatum]|uniref:uncharacterized protein n=1 Tax=Polychytrium aggregatum TaxID=110093 RepID=UPI0022FEFA3A|nr:uncharacterized protein BJ171DRAFT_606858 [Polychytrium aggregatum]XP_052961929.1 uncharacterized protein BJ171DRAFT_610356 [Polychytrium aggregatum]KAI9190617.1 hypothetical protein BJ171DRAFT_606858 [Polychytrium aggregatum]KAI9192991.1 hypothetical protein BJ171DRAFT_610356 [Polychytrium aggregatum]
MPSAPIALDESLIDTIWSQCIDIDSDSFSFITEPAPPSPSKCDCDCERNGNTIDNNGFEACALCGICFNRPLLGDSSALMAMETIPATSYIRNGDGMSKRKRYHLWATFSSSDRLRSKYLREIRSLGDSFKIHNHITESAAAIYVDTMAKLKPGPSIKSNRDHVLYRGDTRIGIQIACFYFAFERANSPIGQRELVKQFHVPLRFLTKGCSILLDIHGHPSVAPMSAADHAQMYCNKLGIFGDQQHYCHQSGQVY